MKEKISRICLTTYAVFFILSPFLAAAPGGSVAFFCVMIALALPPMIAGPKWYRILAIFALLLAITLAVPDRSADKPYFKFSYYLRFFVLPVNSLVERPVLLV